MKLLIYSIRYMLNKRERKELADALNDLKAFKVTDAKSYKVKSVLYDLGYMVAKADYTVYPVTAF